MFNKIWDWFFVLVLSLAEIMFIRFAIMSFGETYSGVVLSFIFLPLVIYCWWAIIKGKHLWSGGYITAGAIWYYTQKNEFVITSADKIVIMLLAITAWILYSPIKRRIKFIKSDVLKGVITAIGLIIVFMFFSGFFTAMF